MMKAMILTAPSTLAVVETTTPPVGDDEVLLRVRACGICGSDLHGWDGSSGRRQPPLIMGHELAGEIAAIGTAVNGWAVGDRVTVDSTLYCGACDACREGHVNLCRERRVLGVATAEFRQNGGFAEFVAVPARGLYRLPDTLSWTHAAMVEPVSIAVHAVRRVENIPSATAVVVGAGMIGLLVIQALRWAGARQIIAVDLEPARLDLARQLGATHTLLSGRDDVSGAVAELTAGRGADVALEVVGLDPTVRLAIDVVRRGGDVVLVGNLAPSVTLPLQAVVTRELTLRGSCGSAGEYPLCLDLIARGEVNVAPLIAAVAPLDEGPEWFRRLTAPGGGGVLKVVLQP